MYFAGIGIYSKLQLRVLISEFDCNVLLFHFTFYLKKNNFLATVNALIYVHRDYPSRTPIFLLSMRFGNDEFNAKNQSFLNVRFVGINGDGCFYCI